VKVSATIVSLVLIGLAPAARAGTPRLADPEYLGRPLQSQTEPPQVKLDSIIAPTSSAPALVAWGESFEISVLLPAGVEPGDPRDWLIALSTRTKGPYDKLIGQPVSMRFPLSVKAVKKGRGGSAELEVDLPARAPRDVYHLELAGPSGVRARRLYAVRVLGEAARRDKLSFVLIADSQLRDPSTHFSGADFNNGAYPRRGDNDAEIMFNQQLDEIAFFDPDFVLYIGDLVFGLDYRQEYQSTLSLWWQKALATYMVPGNHDGLALYELALKEGWWLEALKSVRCAKYVIDGDVTAAAVFQVLTCLFGDLKNMLFEDLAQDGLDYWHRLLGPTDFSFDAGKFHFVGVNSYSGTPERRHAFVIGLGFIGIDLGAATVDNYGGSLTTAQLAWLDKDLKAARARKLKIIMFIHHDPRGTRGEAWGRGYHANLPFPTEPLGLRKFQEWNYDSSEWDSDPQDERQAETQQNNTAVELLKLIAGYVDYVFTGHIHDDEDTIIEAGQEIVVGSNIRAKNKLYIVRVTTASATPETSDGYWGYRLMRTEKDKLKDIVYYPEWNWASLPSGNLWVVGSGVPSTGFIKKMGGGLLFAVHSGLPRKSQGLLRAYLPDAPEGYRFPTRGGQVHLLDVGRGEGGRNIYYLQVNVPAVRSGKIPVPEGEEEHVRIEAERAAGNQAPVVEFSNADDAQPGIPVNFDGSLSKDPEGKPLVQYVWDFGDGQSQRGQKVSHVYEKVGDYTVSLIAIDDCGSFAGYSTRISVSPASSCGLGSSACAATSATFVLVGLVFAGWWLVRRRKRS